MSIVAIVPAAGRGTRFGAAPKLLAPVGGAPMIERTVRSLLDADAARVVVVVADAPAVAEVAVLADPRVAVVVNPDPSRGMFSSIQAGAEYVGRTGVGFAAAGDPAVVLVLPGDMPFVLPDTIRRVADASAQSGRIVTPAVGGKRGHPVALPAALLARIRAAPAQATLAELRDAWPGGYATLDVDDAGVLRDVDVPSDLGPADPYDHG